MGGVPWWFPLQPQTIKNRHAHFRLVEGMSHALLPPEVLREAGQAQACERTLVETSDRDLRETMP